MEKINRDNFAKILRLIINLIWLSIASIAIYIASKEILHLVHLLASNNYKIGNLLHEIVTIFLFIEITAMVVKYFEENYHFPLRYIIYIAIIALARHIIGDVKNAYEYSIAILILAITYAIVRLVSHITKNKNKIPPYEEKNKQ